MECTGIIVDHHLDTLLGLLNGSHYRNRLKENSMKDYNPVKPLFTDRRRPMATYNNPDWIVIWGGITVAVLVSLSIAFLAGWIGP